MRVNHAAPETAGGKQKMLWDDIRIAPLEHMEKAMTLRRNHIVGECCQLKRDQDSYNDNNSHGAKIQIPFNFEKDIVELATIDDYSSALNRKKPR